MGGIGHLREKLFEVVEQRLRLFRQQASGVSLPIEPISAPDR